MPKKNQPYQYGPDDSPLTVAEMFGTNTASLLAANPGGYPFSTGQTINVPFGGVNGTGSGTSQTFQQAFRNAPTPQQLAAVSPIQRYTNQPLPATPAYLRPRGTMGQTISPTPYNNPVIGANGQPLGVYGTFGQQPNLTQPNILEQIAAGGGQSQPPKNQTFNPNRAPEAFDLQKALTSPDKPTILSTFAMEALGINPTENGYTMQGGQWVLNPAATQPPPPPDDGFVPETDPSKILVQYGRGRHKFQTTLKWAMNAQRRKRRNRGDGGEAAAPAEAPAAAPELTGFGLVSFGVGSG